MNAFVCPLLAHGPKQSLPSARPWRVGGGGGGRGAMHALRLCRRQWIQIPYRENPCRGLEGILRLELVKDDGWRGEGQSRSERGMSGARPNAKSRDLSSPASGAASAAWHEVGGALGIMRGWNRTCSMKCQPRSRGQGPWTLVVWRLFQICIRLSIVVLRTPGYDAANGIGVAQSCRHAA